jgi:hypothetical protein
MIFKHVIWIVAAKVGPVGEFCRTQSNKTEQCDCVEYFSEAREKEGEKKRTNTDL